MKRGEAFVPGRSKSGAQEVLAMTRKAGYPASVVKTTDGGYLVPQGVLDAQEKASGQAKRPGKSPARKREKTPTDTKGEEQ